MDGCYAFRGKDIHERKDTHGRWRTLPAWLVVYWGWYIKGAGWDVLLKIKMDFFSLRYEQKHVLPNWK